MEALIPLAILVVLILGIWSAFSGKKQNPRVPKRSAKNKGESSALSTQAFHWEGNGDFEFEIVGESHYQKILASLAGDHGVKSADQEHRATLVLEDDNPHDEKAVGVYLAGKKVGHLSRDDARSYRRRLGGKRLSGVNATCDALIVGGGTRPSGEKLSYGVKLDIKPFG